MSNCRTFIAVVITLVFAAGAQAADVHGVLQVVKGDVQIKSAKDGKVSKAKVGSKIFPKDTITTGKDSRAKIVMVDNNVLNISPETNLEIQNYEYAPEQGKKDVLLNVLYGKVRSKVEQKYDGKSTKFQLKTPTAVAGVRGTDFIGGYTPPPASAPNMPAAAPNAPPPAGTSTFVTFEGQVQVGQIGANNTIVNPVALNPGQMTQVLAGGPVEPPKQLPSDQLAKMNTDSNADTGGPRNPAGAGGGSMMLQGDKPGESGGVVEPPPKPPEPPKPPSDVFKPPEPPAADIVREIIQNGNNTVIIKVTHPSP